MRQLLLLIFLSIAFKTVDAQLESRGSRFAFASISLNGGDQLYEIRIDSGQAAISRRGPIMTDSSGKALKFLSPAAALNYLESVGWKLEEVLHDTEGAFGSGTGSVQTSISYLFKRDD